MESVREIYKIGAGPSSSHTMGPKKAAERYLEKYPNAHRYKVILYGSLAATGEGHLTDKAVEWVIGTEKLDLTWEPDTFLPRHPNAIQFECVDKEGNLSNKWIAYSVGGGSIIDDETTIETPDVYPFHTMKEILDWCYKNGQTMWEFVEKFEGPEIWSYLEKVWNVMEQAIKRGLQKEGTLPGILKYPRKAAGYYAKAKYFEPNMRRRAMVYAYALAVSEENASGGTIVTGPTCGACGVLPAVLYHIKKHERCSKEKILRALATAGLIGTIVKHNASISGAEVGCQGEVGVACAMASGAATQLSGGSIFQIEYAAEMGLEHHLGLTCDPVAGLVQVPCIERNAFAAARAMNHKNYAMLSDGRHFITFDQVVQTMKQTGDDLPSLYKETSLGGLAQFHDKLEGEEDKNTKK